MLDFIRGVIAIFHFISMLTLYPLLWQVIKYVPTSFTDFIHLLFVKSMRHLGAYDPNEASHHFVTWERPLFVALKWGHINTFRYLVLEANANVYAKPSKFSATLIDAAVLLDQREIALWLVNQCGYNVNELNLDTGLHKVVSFGKPEDILFVVQRLRANVEARNHLGESPLHSAVLRGEPEIVRLLVETLNANVNARNNAHETPYCSIEKNRYRNEKIFLEITNILNRSKAATEIGFEEVGLGKLPEDRVAPVVFTTSSSVHEKDDKRQLNGRKDFRPASC